MHMLTANGIKKSFGGQAVLHGVDVEVAPGQITAVIGPSGSGKTTLLRTLALLEQPDSGVICIDSMKYAFPRTNGAAPPPWPAVTVVFQQLFLWPHLTLRRNIELPAISRGIEGARGTIDALITEFGLKKFVDRHPNEVSVGQRQRAALARAIALRPRYLLLDEITSALDIEHVNRVLGTLERLQQEGMGILLVTHLIGFARRSADRVIFMENGIVLEAGGPAVLHSPENGRLRQFLSLVEVAS